MNDNIYEFIQRLRAYYELIQRLREYNEWRRSGNGEEPDPVEIGRDIDEVIDLLEDLAGINSD